METEKYIQIPLPEDYIERLNKRAVECDRVMSREGARIIKDVLDGRYEPVLPGFELRGAPAPDGAGESGCDANQDGGAE